MRNLLLILFFSASTLTYSFGQDISGAYLAKVNDDNHLILVIDGYITHSIYGDNTYKGTQGGTYKIENNNLVVSCEFDDQSPEKTGEILSLPLEIESNNLLINGFPFQKQSVKKQDLDGLWRITGRKTNDNIQTIQRGNRKTIKILVDGYFQWIAINPAEKGFYGTGGGKYSFKDGTYQENILFFSRDNSRVGATLDFNGKIEKSDWHHSGKSSKGDPIYEIWSREK
jgi:hypothetical protein